MNALRTVVLLFVIALFGACGPGESEQRDSQAPPADEDSGQTMAGMDHGPAQDADHEFLRMMSDHHEGLIAITRPVMEAGPTDAQADARMLNEKQSMERDSMVAMIERDYGEQHSPTAMAKNQAQADSLANLPEEQKGPAFYRLVVMHHREGIQMIDQFLARMRKDAVRQMAEKMKADQQREVEEFEREGGA